MSHEPMSHVPCSRPYHKAYLPRKWEVLSLFRSRLVQHSNVTHERKPWRKYFCFAAFINKLKVNETWMQDAISSAFCGLCFRVFASFVRLDLYYSFRIFHISLFNHLSYKYVY